MSLQRVRGTQDLLPEDKAKFRKVVETARDVAECYGFAEIELPIFESTDVFKRTVGETSDIVTKEMYTFNSRSDEELTLRPEGTAGVARAYIQNGLAQHGVSKFFYGGPMFRYERPQKGRQRQFTQFGCEMIGAGDYKADVDLLCLSRDILTALGVWGDVTLELNSLGDLDSRTAYRTALIDYLTPYKNELSADSQTRLHQNPLRVLDSKDENDKKIVVDAPKYDAYLNDDSRRFFDGVQNGLTQNGVNFTINPQLVRGLDYYDHTVFEFITDTLGAQGTVLGGGRYDGLIKQLGGAPTPAVGFAAGVERLALMLDSGTPKRQAIAVIPMGDSAEQKAWQILADIRNAGLCGEMAYSGNMKKRMKQADKIGATHAVILGDDEIAKEIVTLRDLQSGEQSELPTGKLAEWSKSLKDS